MESIYNYSLEELRDILTAKGYPAYTAKQVFDWIYKNRVKNFEEMANISKDIRRFLAENFCFSGLNLIKREKSKDKTEKFLFKLEDKYLIETVLIPSQQRNSLCVSTQVGCKFRCSFCASGQKGFQRNLEVFEIIGQYLEVCSLITSGKITNIVFMGIGEPLDNLDNVVKAINILGEKEGIGLGRRKITVSTCGLLPQIKKLADLKLGIKLAISLHSASDKVREKLMPINKKYPLSGLKGALKYYSDRDSYPISFEYVLLGKTNTGISDAESLAEFLKGIKSKVNLIPYNGNDPRYSIAKKEEIDMFCQRLKKRGVFFTARKGRGQDIEAACGQLKAKYL